MLTLCHYFKQFVHIGVCRHVYSDRYGSLCRNKCTTTICSFACGECFSCANFCLLWSAPNLLVCALGCGFLRPPGGAAGSWSCSCTFRCNRYYPVPLCLPSSQQRRSVSLPHILTDIVFSYFFPADEWNDIFLSPQMYFLHLWKWNIFLCL